MYCLVFCLWVEKTSLTTFEQMVGLCGGLPCGQFGLLGLGPGGGDGIGG